MKEKNSSQSKVSLPQKIALILLGLILSLVLLEGGLRLGGFVLLSMQEFGNLRSIQQKNTYRILCLGESTTEGQYPALLEKALNERDIGVSFSVIDKGIQGTTTPIILSRVKSFLDEYHPDMVVAMMGINDSGKHMPLEVPTTSKGMLFIRSFKIHKLARLLWLHLLTQAMEMKVHKTAESGQSSKKINTPFPRAAFQGTLDGTISAEDSFKKVIEIDPKNDQAYAGLGRLYLDQGKLSQAEDSFKKAIEINPKNDKACVELGWLYQDQGNFPKTEDIIKKAIQLDPEKSDAFTGPGRLYQDQVKLSQAEAFYEKAIEINAENDNAYTGLGRFYQDQGEPSKAAGFYKRAIEINPKNDNACVGLGRIYQRQGKLSQAEEILAKVIELDPKKDKACVVLARLYQEQGKFSEAVGLLKKAITINPENDRLLGALSLLYEEIGKLALAEEYAEKAAGLREYGYSMAANNYRKLKDILDPHGIKLVCVQYPMRNVRSLKEIFEKEKGVIFVDNERVFREAVRKGSYREYFIDMLGGDFGHCTPKGNTLLAQNIAEVIVREAFNK